MTGSEPSTTLPEPGPQRVRLVEDTLERAGQQAAAGDQAGAVTTLSRALELGLWQHTRLWTRLAQAAGPADYPLVRRLWLDSPRRCHRSRQVLRVVAYSAARAGELDEASALLRRAILQERARGRRLRNRLQRAGRRIIGRREPELSSAMAPAAVRDYFHLLDAVVDGDRAGRRQAIAALRDRGERDWLARL